jgi:hypothetical protein
MPTVLGCKIPHELDALKWKAIGRGREEEEIGDSAEPRSKYPFWKQGLTVKAPLSGIKMNIYCMELQ